MGKENRVYMLLSIQRKLEHSFHLIRLSTPTTFIYSLNDEFSFIFIASSLINPFDVYSTGESICSNMNTYSTLTVIIVQAVFL